MNLNNTMTIYPIPRLKITPQQPIKKDQPGGMKSLRIKDNHTNQKIRGANNKNKTLSLLIAKGLCFIIKC